VDAYDRLAGVTRRQQVSLARAGAPRERVTVIWTVSGPEDEAVEDKAERRRLALRRLLREAENQEAAPTDQDLAIALGVSRRTVIRDRKRIDRG
jgi:hypothetical protein